VCPLGLGSPETDSQTQIELVLYAFVAIPGDGWVITLDGPAGSGKSTTARLTAAALGFVYLDTGALYRALTVLALEAGVMPADHEALGSLAISSELNVRAGEDGQRMWAGDRDVTDRLRTPEVDRHVSAVSAVPEVREAMLSVQRGQRRAPGLVAEGRDLGSVVFPDAHLKIYLIADLDVRAERRARERRASGHVTDPATEKQALQTRDETDSTREVAPLRQPDGAVVVDTTSQTIEGQVARVVSLFSELKSR